MLTKSARFGHHLSKSKELILVRFFIALGLAGIDTVWSLYLDSFGLSASTVGFVSATLVILSLVFALISTPILEMFKLSRIVFYSLLVVIISYFAIGITKDFRIFLAIAVILSFTGVMRSAGFAIIFRDNIKRVDLNQAQGFMYAMLNVGWLLGPLVAGFSLVAFGIASVFFLASFFILIALLLFIFIHVKDLHKKRVKIDTNPLKNMKSFLKNKKVGLPSIMAAGIETWWALVYIYMPLFIISNGLPLATVGIFLTIIILPLIVLEQKIGKLSTKKGFRFFFTLGFFGLTTISFILFFIPNMYVQLVLVSIGSIFAAFIEPLQDTFFFKQTAKKDEEKFYPLYNTSKEMGSFIGRMAIAVVLLFLPQPFAYISVAIIMGSVAWCALKISRSSK